MRCNGENMNRDRFRAISDRLLDDSKSDLSFDEAVYFSQFQYANIIELSALANHIREQVVGNRMHLCSLINAKSGNCSEDCAFCAQSVHHQTSIPLYPLKDPTEILSCAKETQRKGIPSFCIVTSGEQPNKQEFEKILETIKLIKQQTNLRMDCSLGKLNKEQVIALADIGVEMYNHNLETAQSYFEQICTTHTYQSRVYTIRQAKQAGLKVCCGGIIGMGETAIQRIELAFALKELDVDCVPINILNPRPGTQMDSVSLTPMEIIKTIAIFRLILRDKTIKIAGGREVNLRDLQSLGFVSGANGMIVGNYLTTSGRNPKYDMQLIKDLELVI